MNTYTIAPGDTLSRIAAKHGISLNELLIANPEITNPSLIFPGQIINIPSTNTYTIMPGDTLTRIASKHGISLNELLAANPWITNPSLIFPGQIINIPGSVPSNELQAFENEVVRLVNIERDRAGLQPLAHSQDVSRVARYKSQDFINRNYFSHNSPTYGTFSEMLRTFGIMFSAAAENIARGQTTPAQVMNSWMNSTGHRNNILSPTYNQIGVGVARHNNGTLFWTQMFIRR